MQEKLTAAPGHVLTNGEIYGTEVYLGEGVRAEDFYEITAAAYQAVLDGQSETADKE